MRNYPTPHCHPGSFDSASIPVAFAEREKQLGTGTLTATDHGTLSRCPEVYSLAKKAKLTPILGLEAYVRDDNDPILLNGGISHDKDGSLSSYFKYFHLTLHALDQAAFETIGRLLSRAEETSERHGSERKPIFGWKDIEELGAQNITFGSGCLIGMVQRHLMAKRPDLAVKYYEKLRSLAKPGNFYVEVFPHRCTHNWHEGVIIQLAGQAMPFKDYPKKRLRVRLGDVDVEDVASDLVVKWKQFVQDEPKGRTWLLAVKHKTKWVEQEPAEILNFQMVSDFVRNECTPTAPDGDIQVGGNRFVQFLARKYGDPILISDDSHFALASDKPVQDVKLCAGGGSWRMHNSYHRQSSEESFKYFSEYMGIEQDEYDSWVDNSYEWASRFGWEWKPRRELPVKFYPPDTLKHTMDLIKRVGRMRWDNQQWKERLGAEIKMLHQNGSIDLLPYFFLDQEVVEYYEKHGQLTGTGRGSAAGMLLTYLLGITHVEPLRYGLSKERFLTTSRIRSGKLPDIDQDLQSRDLLLDVNDPTKGFLGERFPGHWAQISNDTRLRLKSSIKDVHRVKDGFVKPEIEAICKKLPMPPQGVDDLDFIEGYEGPDGMAVEGIATSDQTLAGYIATYPTHWELVKKTLGLVRSKSKHACGFVVSNEPIANFLPTTRVGDDSVPVTQYTKDLVEQVGGLKVDWLEVSALRDIQGCIQAVQKRFDYTPKDERINGLRVPGIRVLPVPSKDGFIELYDIWDLPPDQDVFREICQGKTETVFQFSTPAARKWLELFMVDGKHTLRSVDDLAAFTALDRPGPLDAKIKAGTTERNMLEEFAARATGDKSGVDGSFAGLFPETYDIIVFQEQVQRAFEVIGKATAEQGDDFRIHVSKKKMMDVAKDREIFLKGATETLGSPEAAEKAWATLQTFVGYGFNKSHAVCYAMTGYVCAFLKHHFTTEYWCSVLRNADRSKIETTYWEHCGHMIDPPDIMLSGDDFEAVNGRIRAPLRLLNGVGPKAHEALVEARPYHSLKDFLTRRFDIRLQAGSVTVEQKVNKKTGEVKQKKVTKLGRDQIGTNQMTKMIVAGVLDSMFPTGASTDEKLNIYVQTKQEIEGKKKPDEIDPKFKSMTPLQVFQMRKSILPSINDDLTPLVVTQVPTQFETDQHGRPVWKLKEKNDFEGDDRCPIVSGPDFKDLVESGKSFIDGLAPKSMVGCCAYVTAVDWFWNGQAAKLTLDVAGARVQVTRWPNQKEKRRKSGAVLPDRLVGSVCIVTVSRWNLEGAFSVRDVQVVEQAPLSAVDE
jgi:DNA polymerase III alpha subunit